MAANLVLGALLWLKKYHIPSVTRFSFWNVVSVLVTVSAKSVGQFGFSIGLKIVVLVVHYRTESWAFVLVYVRKKTEFLTAKHWLINWERQFFKKVNTEWQERKFKFCCMLRIMHTYYLGKYSRFFHQATSTVKPLY